MHFALVVFPQFEVLDAFGPTEVIHMLGHPFVNPDPSSVTLSIVGPSLAPVSSGATSDDPSPTKSRIAQTIVPTHTFDNPPDDIDVLIVPGGFGAGPKALFSGDWEPAGIPRVVEFLHQQYPALKHLLSKSIVDSHVRLLCRCAARKLTYLQPFAMAPVSLLAPACLMARKLLRTSNCGQRLLLLARKRIGLHAQGIFSDIPKPRACKIYTNILQMGGSR